MSEPIAAGSGHALAITRDNNRVVIRGHIHLAQDREALRRQVELALENCASRYRELIVDVAEAAYLDVALLTFLIGVARRCVDCGLTLALEGATDELLELLRVTRIDQVLGRHGARIVPAPSNQPLTPTE